MILDCHQNLLKKPTIDVVVQPRNQSIDANRSQKDQVANYTVAGLHLFPEDSGFHMGPRGNGAV